ncbi:hypothetical protein GCM10027428_15730 [Haliea atlantica]
MYQPHLRFYLVDEGRYTEEELAARQSPLSGVFGIENASRNLESLQRAVDRIVEILQADPNKQRTDAIVTRWLKRHLRWLGAGAELEQLNSVVEEKDMLAQNWKYLGEKERLEGQLQGRLEGERHVLERQLTRRFGELPAWATERLASATAQQLEAWADEVLVAGSLEEVFEGASDTKA